VGNKAHFGVNAQHCFPYTPFSLISPTQISITNVTVSEEQTQDKATIGLIQVNTAGTATVSCVYIYKLCKCAQAQGI